MYKLGCHGSIYDPSTGSEFVLDTQEPFATTRVCQWLICNNAAHLHSPAVHSYLSSPCVGTGHSNAHIKVSTYITHSSLCNMYSICAALPLVDTSQTVQYIHKPLLRTCFTSVKSACVLSSLHSQTPYSCGVDWAHKSVQTDMYMYKSQLHRLHTI